MKNILVIGCSFSKFTDTKRNLPYEWPAVLASKINARVYNMSMYSNSLQNQAYQLEQYLANSKIKYDLIIVQLTHIHRTTYIEDQEYYKNFIHNATQNCYDNLDNYYCLPNLSGIVPKGFSRSTEYSEESKSRNVNSSITNWTSKKSLLQQHYLFSIKHDLLYLNTHASEGLALYMLELLKDSNIPYIYYSQTYPFKYAEFVVEDLLPNTLPPKHSNSFFHDKGNHLNNKGVHWFVNNVMLEKVLKYV